MSQPAASGTPLVDATTLSTLLSPRDWLRAAARAYRAYRPGATSPAPLAIPLPGGSLHVKAAATSAVVVVKINANLPGNPRRRGLPTIQGVVAAVDPRDGCLLALIDSGSLTAWRTAAATVVAVRALIRPRARVAAIIGCGVQGHVHASLLAQTLQLRELRLFDSDPGLAIALARTLQRRFATAVRATADLRDACAGAHAIVCCTSSRRPYLRRPHVAPGCVVAAIGADHPRKRELNADLLAASTLVVDSRAQCAVMGEWHHAAGASRRPAEIGEILRGERRGRSRPDEVIVFDSTGFGLQDACAVEAVLARLGGRAHSAFRFATSRPSRPARSRP